ncbi:MAG: phosphatidate cytidylyltransferase [Planctomycetota bacterium]
MNRVAVRTLTGVSLGLVAGAALWWEDRTGTGRVVLAVGVLLSALALVELTRMFVDKSFLLVGLGALLFTAWRLEALGVFDAPALLRELGLVLGFGLALALAALAVRRWFPPGRLPLLARPVLATWIVFPLLGLMPFTVVYGTKGVLALVLLSKLGDVAGYFVGRAIGRSHPFPSISPGKTTAGCVASLVVGSLTGVAVVAAGLLHGTLLAGFVAGAFTNLCAQAGDLFESFIKRRAGVKDSSRLLGASGGVLDVVDSLLFTLPFALFAWPIWFSPDWFTQCWKF